MDRTILINIALATAFAGIPGYATSLRTVATATCLGNSFPDDVNGPGANSACGASFNFQGSGMASSVQSVGTFDLHSISEATFNRTEPAGSNERGPDASGSAEFSDVVPAKSTVAFTIMDVPWIVTGSPPDVNGHAGASISANLGVSGPRDSGSCILSGPGTCHVVILLAPGESVRVSAALTTVAQALGGGGSGDLGQGTARADVSRTAEIGPVAFFDETGTQVFGPTLVDDSGFAIPIAAEVPEPLSMLLVFSGLTLLAWKSSKEKPIS